MVSQPSTSQLARVSLSLSPSPSATSSQSSCLSNLSSPYPLELLGLRVHNIEGIILCLGCDHAIQASAALQHVKSAHHIYPPNSARPAFHSLCDSLQLHTPHNIRFPEFGLPPIEGLRVVPNGWICSPCQYAAPQEDSIRKHWTTKSHLAHAPARRDYRVDAERGAIQSFFAHPGSQRWFHVKSPVGCLPSTMFDSYMTALGNGFDLGTHLLPAPSSAKENNAMNKITYWDVHLGEWLRDSGSVDALRSVMTATHWRKRTDQGPDRLGRIVLAYLVAIRAVAHESSLAVRSMLMKYPRDDNHGKVWRPHDIDQTLRGCAGLLHRFVFAILCTEGDECRTTYRLPLTTFEKKHVTDYRLILNTHIPNPPQEPTTTEIERFHSFIAVFLLKRTGSNVTTRSGKFDLPLECLCAIDSVEKDGKLRTAKATTGVFATLKYLIRGTVLYEAHTQLAQFDGILDSAIESIAQENLRVSVTSPYNVIVDLQRAVSRLAYLSVGPPTMRVSEDMNTFHHGEKTLHFPDFREGLSKGIVAVQTCLDKLLFGTHIPYQIPSVVSDDWACDRRGYSFLHANTFLSEKKPYLRGLMEVIGKRDAAGGFMLNVAGVAEVLSRDEEFLEHLMPALFIGSSSARGSEFADHKHANGPVSRTLFMNGTDLWLVTRRQKQSKTEVFVPVLVPPVLANILLHYLIVVRPAIIELVWATKGEEAAILHGEYLFVCNGTRIDGDRLSVLLERFTSDYCQVELNLRHFRQFQVAILRSRLGSEAEIDEDEDDIFCQLAGHSLSTTRTHYAKEYNHLTSLSSDLLRRHPPCFTSDARGLRAAP
ncbi:hypothetical protein C8R47DRAFT_1230477 [Mycena vitilis]|nr:hypothetical protein C8R47DRAFT_1230477 [Mycena vitilis]